MDTGSGHSVRRTSEDSDISLSDIDTTDFDSDDDVPLATLRDPDDDVPLAVLRDQGSTTNANPPAQAPAVVDPPVPVGPAWTTKQRVDAWASRVKCPARFVSHLHDICIYMHGHQG